MNKLTTKVSSKTSLKTKILVGLLIGVAGTISAFSFIGGLFVILPDLTITKTEMGVIKKNNFVLRKPANNERYAIRVTVKNIGRRAVSNFQVLWDIPNSNRGSRDYNLLLKPYGMTQILIPFPEGTGVATGNYNAEITVDFQNLIKESNEQNNSTSVNFIVAGGAISQVQNLTAKVSRTSVSLNWSVASSTMGIGVYNIYRSTVSGFTPSLSNLIAQGNILSYTDTDVRPIPGTFYYRIAAQDVQGTVGPASVEVKAVIQ